MLIAISAIQNPATAGDAKWHPVANALGKSGTEMPGGIYRVDATTVAYDGATGNQLWIAPAKLALGTILSVLICLPSLYIFACLGGIDARLVSAFAAEPAEKVGVEADGYDFLGVGVTAFAVFQNSSSVVSSE